MLELKNHPSQARHPFTDEPLVDDSGPVPLFPNMRGIYYDGRCIGYVGTWPDAPVTLCVPVPESIRSQVQAFVQQQLGAGDKPRKVMQPPSLAEVRHAQEHDDDDE